MVPPRATPEWKVGGIGVLWWDARRGFETEKNGERRMLSRGNQTWGVDNRLHQAWSLSGHLDFPILDPQRFLHRDNKHSPFSHPSGSFFGLRIRNPIPLLILHQPNIRRELRERVIIHALLPLRRIGWEGGWGLLRFMLVDRILGGCEGRGVALDVWRKWRGWKGEEGGGEDDGRTIVGMAHSWPKKRFYKQENICLTGF